MQLRIPGVYAPPSYVVAKMLTPLPTKNPSSFSPSSVLSNQPGTTSRLKNI